MYKRAGFDMLVPADVPEQLSYSATSTGVPGWLLEMFVNTAKKQARKRKPELVLMTRGFLEEVPT